MRLKTDYAGASVALNRVPSLALGWESTRFRDLADDEMTAVVCLLQVITYFEYHRQEFLESTAGVSRDHVFTAQKSGRPTTLVGLDG